MSFIKKSLVVLCFGLLGNSMVAQTVAEQSPDKIYDDLGYKKSIPLYQNKAQISQEEMARIAKAYRLNHDTENAELWYGQIAEKTSDPLHVFYYAQALQSNGKREKAKRYFLKYDEMAGEVQGGSPRGKLFADAIDKTFPHTNLLIKNESLINTGKLEFSPAFYKEGIIFVSTRGAQSIKDKKTRDGWTDDNFMALFYAKKNEEDNLSEAEEFSVDLTTEFHEGPVCFSKNGEQLFFTRNDYVNNTRRNSSDGTMKLQIYSSTKSGDSWSAPFALPFNTVDHEEAHPALSPDGSRIYFSSNRPGGFGGMDLYYADFTDGSWGDPVNMGEGINSPENEVFPWMHDDGTLYFASNGWGGLGGLDIFSTFLKDSTVWMPIQNVGTPFNSKKDDFGLIFNAEKTGGYLTSARKNGAGQDDIYSFSMPKNLPVKMQVCAFEQGSANRLADVKFEVIESMGNGKDDMFMTLEKTGLQNEYILKFKQQGLESSEEDVVNTFSTNEEGVFETYFEPNRKYLLIASKDGYTIGKKEFDGAELIGKSFHEVCVSLDKMNCMVLDGVVKHKKYGNVIPNATVTMTNLCDGEDVIVTSDKDGYFNFPCIPCGCDIVFKASKNTFRDGASKENTIGENCKPGSKISTELLLDNDPEKLKAMFAGIELKEGAIIELEKIYYDFDQYYIRDDAKDELDHIVDLLNLYPNMVIELSSHTDARATDRYNETLSQNRAEAAVDYIATNGIDRSRLVAKGYGEKQLKNKCANYVECTEEEHQRNRRTEIKILKFDRKDIEVNHIDNEPETVDPANPERKFRWE